MKSNERFSDDFRLETFEEIRSVGFLVTRLGDIVQNPIPLTDEDFKAFNERVDICIARLNKIRNTINNEAESDRLVPFEE